MFDENVFCGRRLDVSMSEEYRRFHGMSVDVQVGDEYWWWCLAVFWNDSPGIGFRRHGVCRRFPRLTSTGELKRFQFRKYMCIPIKFTHFHWMLHFKVSQADRTLCANHALEALESECVVSVRGRSFLTSTTSASCGLTYSCERALPVIMQNKI